MKSEQQKTFLLCNHVKIQPRAIRGKLKRSTLTNIIHEQQAYSAHVLKKKNHQKN